MKKRMRFISFAVLLVCIVPWMALPLSAKEKFPLDGKGTLEDPYIIGSVGELATFRDLVNSGNGFQGQYVEQVCDLDLGENEETAVWEPIGNWGEDLYFYGVYNGGGNAIYNLNTENSISGFFSCLGGTVMNLGIESGSISGDYVGGISGHCRAGAKIINCYNLADVSGVRAGGIADNFTQGSIIDCFAGGKVEGSEVSGGIVGYNAASVANCTYAGDANALPSSFDGVAGELEQVTYSDDIIFSLKEEFKEGAMKGVTAVCQMLKISDGQGSEEQPYIIENAKQLERLGLLVNIGNSFGEQWFRQEADIDFGEYESWEPIGKGSFYFDGIYDGGGNSLQNLHIKGEAGETVGFFGSLSGVVMNLGIDSGKIEGDFAAGLVGSSAGDMPMIINCYNNADVMGGKMAAGIAVSLDPGIIVNCLNTGNIISQGKSAGICVDEVRRMRDCYSVGSDVVAQSTQGGVIRSSCLRLDSTSQAAKMLNKGLYSAAAFTNYQRNNLVKWNSDGTQATEYYNYFAPYMARLLLVGLLIIAVSMLVLLLYKTASRRSGVGIGEICLTLSESRKRWIESVDRRIGFIICCGFGVCLAMILSSYINGNNSITRDFGFSSSSLYDFIVPMRSVLNENFADNGYYSAEGGTYPPIARLVIYFVGKLMPADSHYAWESQMKIGYGNFVVMMFVIICLGLFFIACQRLNKRGITLLSVLAVFSSPMIFMIDRGNVLCLVVAASAFFVAGYRSENSVIRHLAYICLALAASIKLYPVVLGLLVLKEKKWKHTVQCIAYGVAFCVLPFLVIGLDELALYIRNVSSSFASNSVNVSEWLVDYGNIMTTLFHRLFDNAELGKSIAQYTIYPLMILLVGCIFLCRERWKAITAVMLIQILYPGFTVYYCLAFLAIPMLVFVSDRHTRKLDYAYAIMFMLCLVPLQFLCGAVGLTRLDIWVFGGATGLILAFVLIADCMLETLGRVRAWQKEKNNALEN